MSLALKIRSLFHPRRAEYELDDELQFHFDQQVEENLAAGMPRAEAERAALRVIGGLGHIKEECRDARGTVWLTDFLHDLRYALRTLRRSPGFALAAVLTLAIGIGANTTVFSIADAVLFKMLPLREPNRLIQVLQPEFLTNEYFDAFSFVNYREMQDAVRPFADLAAERPPFTAPVTIDGARESLRRSVVSGNYFAALGIRPVAGRLFDPAMDADIGGHPEAVISYGFWQRRFNGAPRVIGRGIKVADAQFVIVGVSEPGFFGTQVGSMTDVWTPVVMEPARRLRLRGATLVRLIGRLRPGATESQALAPLQSWYHNQQMDGMRHVPPGTPASIFERAAQLRLKVVPAAKGISPLRKQYGEPIQIVFAVVAVVLLLTCGNVANLLLARASARQRELAVRVSLGAGRWRLVRQLLTESLLLAASAAVLGLLVANWTVPVLVGMLAPSDSPVQLAVGLDLRVLAFTAAVSLTTAVAFGLLPALRASRVEIHATLKSGSRTAGRSPANHGRLLMAAQVALSLVLLVTSALFVHTLWNLKRLDAGFDRHHVILAGLQFGGADSGERLTRDWLDLLQRAMAAPGVDSASLSIGGPFAGSHGKTAIRVQAATGTPNLDPNWFIPVSPNYFRTLGTPLVMGRDFEPRDFAPSAAPVAIISAAGARRYFPNQNPLGHKIADFETNPPGWTEVVGVAPDMKFDSLRTAAPAVLYLPFTLGSDAPPRIMTMQLRAHRDTGSLARALRQQLAAANPEFALGDLISQDKLVDDTLVRERLLATAGTFFGAIALLLAGIGIYGTINYSVSRRTQEIGIRMALGARPSEVLAMVLREALTTVAVGAFVGLAASRVLTRMLAGLLFGLKPQDLPTMTLAGSLLAIASLAAALVPAVRACRADPLRALRTE
jgi:predicted permease